MKKYSSNNSKEVLLPLFGNCNNDTTIKNYL